MLATSAEAEAWWPVVLRLDASVGTASSIGNAGKQASRDLLWAVLDTIWTLKRSGQPDARRVDEALANLEWAIARP